VELHNSTAYQLSVWWSIQGGWCGRGTYHTCDM